MSTLKSVAKYNNKAKYDSLINDIYDLVMKKTIIN